VAPVIGAAQSEETEFFFLKKRSKKLLPMAGSTQVALLNRPLDAISKSFIFASFFH
jgi:hypothetical protein